MLSQSNTKGFNCLCIFALLEILKDTLHREGKLDVCKIYILRLGIKSDREFKVPK